MQALTTLLVVLAVGATLNEQNGWYADWSDLRGDLLGQATPHGVEATHGASPPPLGPVPSAVTADEQARSSYAASRERTEGSLRLRPNPGAGGQYVKVRIPGPTGKPARLLIWLPAAYTDPAQASRTFPVIEAFHGVPGGPGDLRRPIGLGATISELVAERLIAPTVVVAPDYTPGALDTECVDAPGLPMNTWLSKDVPQWVIRNLRVRPDPASWTTLGYSAGGWCAAVTAMNHPDRFGSMIVLGGYFKPIFNSWKPFGRSLPARYDLLRMEREAPPRLTAWVQVALQDPVSGRVSQRFAHDARPPMSVTSMTWRRVGHRMSVWISAIPDALQWLARTHSAYAPEGGAPAIMGAP
nr:alpha/beta hydrolase-fold protein [Flexivirga aerilata]